MLKNVLPILICFLFLFTIGITKTEKQNMKKALKDGRYDIASNIMLKEFKENALKIKNKEKTVFKNKEELIYYYSVGFTKMYFENLKRNKPNEKINKNEGLVLTTFIIELYEKYKEN